MHRRVDNTEARRLLLEIDEDGRNLSKNEIRFVAELIDSNTHVFREEDYDKLKDIHERRVVDADPNEEIE